MKKFHYIVFVALAMAICSASAIAMLFGYEGENRENRPLARFPKALDGGALNLAFPAQFDRYFEDHFGLREEMVTSFHALTMATLGDTLNEKVVVGDGMLFFEETLDDYLGINRMSDAEIDRAATALRLQSEFAASIGATFTFAAAPNKNTVYPERMPKRFSPTGLPSNRERLYDALAKQGVATLDFAALLNAHKADGLLYHPSDTHWNERGALLASEAIMQKILENARPSNAVTNAKSIENPKLVNDNKSLIKLPADYSQTPTTQNDYAGDLHNFVLPAVSGTNPRPVYALNADYVLDPRARPAQDAAFGTRPANTNTSAKATLYLMRDSFADALIPFLSPAIERAVYSREFPYNYTTVANEAPTAVMIELVERNIPNLLLSAPLMPALEKETPQTPPIDADVATKKRGQYTQVFGCFEGKEMLKIANIYVTTEKGTYEAFPIMEKEAEEMAKNFELPIGFSVTLPKEDIGEKISIFAVS